MKNVLVTGGAGFIGSFLVDDLIQKGHKVVSIDSLEEQVHKGQKPSYLNPRCDYHWAKCSDRDLLRRVLPTIDVVVHLAAIVGVGQSMYEIARYTEGNTLATAVLLEEMAQFKGSLKKIIVASSMSVYGEGCYALSSGKVCYPELRSESQLKRRLWDPIDPVTSEVLKPLPTSEDKPLRPASIYAIGKRDQEEMCMVFGKTYGVPCTALRFFNIYGSRQALSNPYTGVAAIFSSRLLLHQAPLVFEDGNQMRDFIHISDVLQALMLVLSKDSADFEVFNIGSGAPISINAIAETLSKKITKGNIKPIITNQYRAGDIRHCYSDISKAKKILNFNPNYRFEDGADELVGWVKSQVMPQDNFSDALRHAQDKGIIS